MAAPHTGGAQLVAPAASIIIVFFITLSQMKSEARESYHTARPARKPKMVGALGERASLFFTEPPCHENNLNNCKDNLSLVRGLTRPRPFA
jgi:hypothetical protein